MDCSVIHHLNTFVPNDNIVCLSESSLDVPNDSLQKDLFIPVFIAIVARTSIQKETCPACQAAVFTWIAKR